MLLLALQTTTAIPNNSRLDAITLVLVVIFIASMVVLSLLLRRRQGEELDDGGAPGSPSDRSPAEKPVAHPEMPVRSRSPAPEWKAPVWLQGVAAPSGEKRLSEGALVIEALLEARRKRDLAGGLALYTPEGRKAVLERMGLDEDSLADVEFEGDIPGLRSIELLRSKGVQVELRAGFGDGTVERYRLRRSGGSWEIEEITPER